jgi:uncharacterized protein (TIGR02246 family)
MLKGGDSMMKRYLLVTLLLLGVSMAICLSAGIGFSAACQKASATTDEKAVDQLRQDFNAAYNAGGAAAIANLVTEDTVWMPPGEPAVIGREAVKARYAAQFKGAVSQFELQPGEIQASCTWAFLRGTYTRTDTHRTGGQAKEYKGKYLMIMRKQPDGSWKIARDIWNSDTRP